MDFKTATVKSEEVGDWLFVDIACGELSITLRLPAAEQACDDMATFTEMVPLLLARQSLIAADIPIDMANMVLGL